MGRVPSEQPGRSCSAGRAHRVELLKGLLAALTEAFPPPGQGAGGRSQAWLAVLGFSGESGGGGKRSRLWPSEGWARAAGQTQTGLPPTWDSRAGVAGEATRKMCAPRRHPIPSLPPQGKAQVRTGASGSGNASQDSCSPSSHPNPRPSALQGERAKALVAVKGLCGPCPPLPCRSPSPAQAVSSLSPA